MFANPSTSNLPTTEGFPVVITLFNGLRLTMNGASVNGFRSNKVRALLAYLLLNYPHRVSRVALSALLWPTYADTSAQANLRQSLANLRGLLAPFDLLQADHNHIKLRLDDHAVVWCDAIQFNALLDACHHHPHTNLMHCSVCLPRLQQAVALSQGGLFENFPEIESAPFNAWLADQQTLFAARLAEAKAALTHQKTLSGNLPPPLTSLIGRTAELADLTRKLQHPVYRCVSIVGPGGIGKTRLACAVGDQMRSYFPAGVWLVELNALPPTIAEETLEQLQDRLAAAIAIALDIQLQGTMRPAAQVQNYLENKTALLILDGFEHLDAGAAWLPALLTGAPSLRLLLTTRHRPPLQSQLLHQLQGLAVPPPASTSTVATNELIAHYASLQLFVERAESVQMPLRRNARTLTAVSQLCRFVDGSPWAIELAVSLLDQQSPHDLLQALRRNYRALATPLLDVPERQRSAEAIFQTAWQLLTPREAQTLAYCAVFQGSFTQAAAQNVAAATTATLDALVHKSLLRLNGPARYTIHDLVRQFASEQLAHDAATAARIQAAHAAYFTALLATWQPNDAAEQQFRMAVTRDWENVQAAWAWAVAVGAAPLLWQGVRGLNAFFEIAGLYNEAERTFAAAIRQVRLLPGLFTREDTSAPRAQTTAQTLFGYLLWCYSYFATGYLGKTEQGQRCAEELVLWGRTWGDPTMEARGYSQLSLVALYQGAYPRQHELLLCALPLAQQQGDLMEQIFCLSMLGLNFTTRHEYVTAQAYFEQALALAQTYGSSRPVIGLLNRLGALHWSAGHFSAAITYFQQVLPEEQRIMHKGGMTFTTAYFGEMARTLGDYGNARRYLEQARQGYRELGDQVTEAQILTRLAALFAELGEVALARDYCRRALATPTAQLYAVRCSTLAVQGDLHRATGDWAAARTAYQAANTLSQQNHEEIGQLFTQAYLAAVDWAQGETAAALARVEEVLANFAAKPCNPGQRPQELLLIAYQILVANHDPRAPAVLQHAWQVVQQDLAQISDPQLRHTYLTNVPVNRTLAQLVQ